MIYPPVAAVGRSRWTPEQLALLCTMPDADAATSVGKSINAVRVMRTRRSIATAEDGRKSK